MNVLEGYERHYPFPKEVPVCCGYGQRCRKCTKEIPVGFRMWSRSFKVEGDWERECYCWPTCEAPDPMGPLFNEYLETDPGMQRTFSKHGRYWVSQTPGSEFLRQKGYFWLKNEDRWEYAGRRF